MDADPSRPVTSTVPDLTDDYDLDPCLISRFQDDGHVLVQSLASAEEAAAYREIIEPVAIDAAWDKRPLEERETYGRAFLQSFNLWRRDPEIATFVLSPRFARLAAALLGVDRVRLYHDQALCKEPGGGHTPWHQDQHYWPIDTDKTITMWMPLVDVPPEVGSMTFAVGSHRLDDLRGGGISEESDTEFEAIIRSRGLPTHTYGAVKAGDATFHAGWTIHSASPNPTDELRTVMTVIYVADGARVPEQISEAQEVDRQAWLGGTPLGAPIDHPLNPLLG